MNKTKLTNKGFTIIELMIATMVFSIVLLICAFALLQIGRTYYKGLNAARTQEAARTIVDEIARGIQFSGNQIATTPDPPNTSSSFVFCVGDQRFTAQTGQQVEDGNNSELHQQYHALAVDNYPGCNNGSPKQDLTAKPISGRELVPIHMRLAKLEVKDMGNNLYEVNVRVVLGDDDLLCSPEAGDCSSTSTSEDEALNNRDLICKSFRSGAQFCAVSELNTVVQKRI